LIFGLFLACGAVLCVLLKFELSFEELITAYTQVWFIFSMNAQHMFLNEKKRKFSFLSSSAKENLLSNEEAGKMLQQSWRIPSWGI
jgi:hypothetical protein